MDKCEEDNEVAWDVEEVIRVIRERWARIWGLD
jgi:hypothetical protein